MIRESTGVPGIWLTIVSEWTKLRSIRQTWTILGAAMAACVGLSGMVTVVVASSYPNMSPDQKAVFDPSATSLVGLNIGLVVFAILGVQLIATEYSSGMMRLTLAVTPNRGQVFLAKGAIVVLLTAVPGTLFAFTAFVFGQGFISSIDGAPHLGLGDPGVVRGLLGWGIEMAAFGLIAMSLGVLLRNATGAIATTIGIIFGPLIIGQVLSDSIQRSVLSYLPGFAAANLSTPQANPTSTTYLQPFTGGAVLIIWTLAFVVAGYVIMATRDSG